MYNSVKINGVDIKETYGLELYAREINPPEPQTSYLEVPFRNGSIDLTEKVTGSVRYKDRTIKLGFVYGGMNTQSKASEFYKDFHGKKVEIIFEDEPDFFYSGRLRCTEMEDNHKNFTLNAEVTADPYKYDTVPSDVDWEWDIFNFDSGLINETGNLVVGLDYVEVSLFCRHAVEIPTFISSESLVMQFGGKEYIIREGESKLYNVFFEEGLNEMKFKVNTNVFRYEDTATLSIRYIGGSL